jgi:hypothetical protein
VLKRQWSSMRTIVVLIAVRREAIGTSKVVLSEEAAEEAAEEEESLAYKFVECTTQYARPRTMTYFIPHGANERLASNPTQTLHLGAYGVCDYRNRPPALFHSIPRSRCWCELLNPSLHVARASPHHNHARPSSTG